MIMRADDFDGKAEFSSVEAGDTAIERKSADVAANIEQLRNGHKEEVQERHILPMQKKEVAKDSVNIAAKYSKTPEETESLAKKLYDTIMEHAAKLKNAAAL